jgi:hypothetical protein
VKRKNFIHSIFILYLLIMCCAVRYFNDPVYADSTTPAEYESQTSHGTDLRTTPRVAYWRYGPQSKHKDFLKFALTLNEVNHGENEGNSVQRMREDKLEMPVYWFYAEGWQELTLDQKRTLVAGCAYFLNLYLRESICFNEKLKTTYDQFSARITVEEIVNHVENLYKMPQYRDEDVEWLIADYMQYGFWQYMGLPIVHPS